MPLVGLVSGNKHHEGFVLGLLNLERRKCCIMWRKEVTARSSVMMAGMIDDLMTSHANLRWAFSSLYCTLASARDAEILWYMYLTFTMPPTTVS